MFACVSTQLNGRLCKQHLMKSFKKLQQLFKVENVSVFHFICWHYFFQFNSFYQHKFKLQKSITYPIEQHILDTDAEKQLSYTATDV